ncbi:MAG: NUDIX domain-containing protein [Gammaproteobacteria bacterium]|nr:MAG: NUDIX domain-containing protein [Gammaproteobacteria bacterium]
MGERRRRELIYEGRVIRLELAEVRLPDGRPMRVEHIRHPGGAAVAAVDPAGRVCLLRQWRPALERWLWELPAGTLEPGEPPLEAARRELAEEAGLEARRWEPLGRVAMAPGFCDELIHLFLARELRPVPPRREPGEVLEVHWLPLEEAVALALGAGDTPTGDAPIEDAPIEDAKTVAGLLRAQARLGARASAPPGHAL